MHYQIIFEDGLQKGCLLLTQWDRNVQLTISGLPQLPENVETHWGNVLAGEFLNVEPTVIDDTIEVSIPNILLQMSADIIGYIYINESTFYRIDIQVQSRAKPQDVPTDPEVPYYPLGLSSIDIESLKAINSLAILALLGGGTLNQVLKKKSNKDLDFEWQDGSSMATYQFIYDGIKIRHKHNGEIATFTEIKDKCLDDKYFVYLTYQNRLYIPNYVKEDADIYFGNNFNVSGKVYQRRINIQASEAVGYTQIELAKIDDLDEKQDTLTAGTGISIDENNVISVNLPNANGVNF